MFQLIPLIIGAAMTAAGVGMQAAANENTRKRMNEALDAELDRQRRLQEEASPIVKKSVEQSSPDVAQQQLYSGAAKRKAAYEELQQQRLGSSQPLDKGTAKTVTAASEQKKTQGNLNRAALMGYSEWELQQLIKNMQVANKLGTIAGFAEASASILPYELRDAQGSQANLSGIGSLLQQGGQTSTSYGLSGGSGGYS